jgi:ParB-like chromosome segregation protein Spo0J
MNVQTLLISEIIVPERRRDDFGDLDGLAESIRKYGLLHPITVDDKNNLIAGERRLRACQLLDWSEIDCRLFRDLTEDERHEIELEENIRRKDLTPFEQSKNLVSLAETAAQVLTGQADEFSGIARKNSKRGRDEGRPSQPATAEKVAERIGVDRKTLSNAKEHVAAVETYPELKEVSQTKAISTAKALDKLPEPKREQVRADTSKLRQIISKPSLAKPSKRSPVAPVQELIYQIKQKGGALSYTGRMTQHELFTFRDELASCRDELDSFVCELTDHMDDLRDTA